MCSEKTSRKHHASGYVIFYILYGIIVVPSSFSSSFLSLFPGTRGPSHVDANVPTPHTPTSSSTMQRKELIGAAADYAELKRELDDNMQVLKDIENKVKTQQVITLSLS